MNRDRCLACPHRAYLHDDTASPIGPCRVEGCACPAFVSPRAPKDVPDAIPQDGLW